VETNEANFRGGGRNFDESSIKSKKICGFLLGLVKPGESGGGGENDVIERTFKGERGGASISIKETG